MKFCILMPAYNAEKDLEKAIRSVLAQTHSDFLLIVVNDGSTDQTAEILHDFEKDGRIKILSQNNTGIAGAYQNAFAHLDGDYVMFLDSDDALAPEALQEIAEAIEKTKSDMVQFGISYFDEEWNHKRDLLFQDRTITSNDSILHNYFTGINNGSDRPNLGIRAYKRELLADFIFPPKGSLGIDEILNLYGMKKAETLTFLSKPYYLCQQRVNSVSRIKPSAKKVAGILQLYSEMEKILLPTHSEFQDLLYVKFVRFFISHLNIIKKLPAYKTYKANFRKYLSVTKKSSRVRFSKKDKMRIFLLSHAPFLSAVLSKN